MTNWNVDFLKPIPNSASVSCSCGCSTKHDYALIILNQPFSYSLLQRVWNSALWRCCADGGANRLYDVLTSLQVDPELFLPDLIKGDLDSLRCDVREYYASHGVPVVQDHSQNSTDLMKCVHTLQSKEQSEGRENSSDPSSPLQYDIIILGGLAGRLDQTIHTLSYLHKLRKTRKRVYAVTDDNVGWVLDSGEHRIHIDHTLLGQTCGLLPVGIDETVLSTSGLRWNLTDHPSSFDGLVSTSNHLVPGEDVVWVKTTKPIWWTAELRSLIKGIQHN
ncbi:thiamine pyrophosphokinase Thi80 [Macrolepiota fuliginosa MF-IS2]|uniref:Thiamine pyrophosphokinase n=1 Tax=Macrolepiota fuliginosa MF-IS2 TaxID=1400762 RepID=A0A9P6C362_9AGAR|nr:thiamine pyrophosphokinase Thi80 [Macrolepiota fuliginosa MF-IS2]